MRKYNPENEFAKRNYAAWLKGPGRRSETTVDQALAAIAGFEAFTRRANFKTFRIEQAISYREHLAEQLNSATSKPLSLSTQHSRLSALKAFFEWLAREPGYRKPIRFNDAAYFTLSNNQARTATAKREQRTPSLEQVTAVLEAMPTATVFQRRDRAVVAFTLLTGARDSACASLRLKHVDVSRGCISQDAREVRTKGAKTFTSFFFPVGDLPTKIVVEWVDELRTQHLFGPDDPLFPATVIAPDEAGLFAPAGLKREPWGSAAPIREIFRRGFALARLEYFHPHSLRRTLMRVAYDLNLSPKEMKAWSQNLGHESVQTSLASYGHLPLEEQRDVLAQVFARPSADPQSEELLRQIAALVTNRKVGR